MTVPYSFGAATSAIPLSQLDSNFNTPITLGNTAIQLGNTVTTLNNMTLANVTISSGNVTITNVTVTTANATTVNTTTLIATTANVTTGNVTNLISGNVSLTGGSITGTPISGSTGSFTTLTTSSTVTLNGGTANGVAYLNASNVLTTGSALTFDGTGLAVTGTTSATLKLNGRSSDNASSANFYDNTGATRYGFIYFDPTTGGQIATTNANPLAFLINSAEQMRLTSTGLGIGTSSPGVRLDVAAAKSIVRSTSTTGTNATYFIWANTGANFYVGLDNSTGSEFAAAYSGVIWHGGAYPLLFGTSNVERMRLDASGNLGIGTSSPLQKLDVLGSIAVRASTSGANQDVIALRAVNSDYTAYANAIYYANSHRWAYAGATEGMLLDSSGNLGLGVTPSDWNANNKVFQLSNNASLFSRSGLTGVAQNFRYNASDTGIFMSAGYATLYYQNAGKHIWAVSTTSWNGTGSDTAAMSQAMTLDASGNLAVGTTSTESGVRLWVGNSAAQFNWTKVSNSLNSLYAGVRDTGEAAVSSSNAYPLLFYTNATERARIDSSGNLLVGTTSSNSGRMDVEAQTGGVAISFRRNTGVYGSNTVVGTIACDSSSTAYNTSSDYRLKHDIAPMTGALAKVAKLKPCTYKWNADNSAGEGFIAHELAEVVPQAVTGGKDAVDAEGKPVYQGIDTSFLVATLTAAIQELKAEFDAYKATHP